MIDLRGFPSLQERYELCDLLHRNGHSAQEHGRASAILLLDDVIPISLIAMLLSLPPYQAGKPNALPGDSRASTLSDLQKEQPGRHIIGHLNVETNELIVQRVDSVNAQAAVTLLTYLEKPVFRGCLEEDARRVAGLETTRRQIRKPEPRHVAVPRRGPTSRNAAEFSPVAQSRATARVADRVYHILGSQEVAS